MWNLGEPELLRVFKWNLGEPGARFRAAAQTTPKLYWKNPKLCKLLGEKEHLVNFFSSQKSDQNLGHCLEMPNPFSLAQT